MVKFRPIGDRVLLKRIEQDNTTPSGIVLAPKSQAPSNQAVVVVVGKGKMYDNGVIAEPLVAQGMHVVAAKNAGQDIKLEGEEFWLVREHDIMYIVEHEEDQ